MTSFEPVKALLQPTFESYRLSSDKLLATSYDLALAAAAPRSVDEVNADARLSWKDVRSRARWNNLMAGNEGEVAWIETAQREVWSARFDRGEPKASKLFDIPPLASSSDSSEVPTLCASAGRFIFSDGHGTLHTISWNGQHLSAAHLALDGQPTPFRLHAIDTASQSALISSNVFREIGSKSSAVFEVAVIKLPEDGALDQGQLEILGRWRGEDVPSYARCDDGQWVVGADSSFAVYPAIEQPVPSTSTAPFLSGAVAEPPRYRWTQSSDSVDIDIPSLPSTLKTSDFKISFSPSYISVLSSSLDAPRFAHRQLWAPVDSGACTWTWEAEDGLLSLHLEKKDEGTRWTALFASAPEEGEVAETLSDAQLETITASLDKHTSDVPVDFEAKVGLLGDEMDDEVDAEDGEGSTAFTTLSSTPSTSDRVTLITSSLFGTDVVVKRSYDGLLYEWTAQGWKHTVTYPALAFVLASKRYLRYRFHCGSRFALALEGGGPVSAGGNVYAYWPPKAGEKAKHATQAVTSLGGGVVRGAAVLDEDRIVVLCERELIVLSGFAGAS